jgi:hypothetical protein
VTSETEDSVGHGLLDWLRERALAERHIKAEDLAVLRVVARPAEVCEIVEAAHRLQREHGIRQRRHAAAKGPEALN